MKRIIAIAWLLIGLTAHAGAQSFLSPGKHVYKPGNMVRPLIDGVKVYKRTAELLKEVAIFPRAMHPAVWTRKSGEKVLHIGPWMSVGVEHHENPEDEAMYDEVCHEINRLGEGTCAYWHEWKSTDMVIWDNWRMLHSVSGMDPKYERRMQRTTIVGDYGLGFFENDGKGDKILEMTV